MTVSGVVIGSVYLGTTIFMTLFGLIKVLSGDHSANELFVIGFIAMILGAWAFRPEVKQ